VTPDHQAGRRRAAGRQALVGTTCVALTSLVIAAVSDASSHRPSHSAANATAVQSIAVGPKGSPAGEAVAIPAPSGGASQVVSGVAASTSGVRFSVGALPAYYGTEPGTMTLARHGHELLVTVVPR
jgi:hypothetical protein